LNPVYPEHRRIPVVVISTEGSQNRIGRLQEKGAVFIRKPYAPEKVCDLLKQMPGEEVFDQADTEKKYG